LVEEVEGAAAALSAAAQHGHEYALDSRSPAGAVAAPDLAIHYRRPERLFRLMVGGVGAELSGGGERVGSLQRISALNLPLAAAALADVNVELPDQRFADRFELIYKIDHRSAASVGKKIAQQVREQFSYLPAPARRGFRNPEQPANREAVCVLPCP